VFSERCDVNFSRVCTRVERLSNRLVRLHVKQADSRRKDSA
jgi:hypothetical protein